MKKTVLQSILIAFFPALIAASAQAAVMIPSPPPLASTAYILIDAETGAVLVENNADQKVPPASLTKMMTSYVVSDELARGKIKETDMVLITDDAWTRGGSKSGGSTMFLDPRSRVPILDLLRGVIIQSGNDASIAIAEHLAGSEDAFAEVMNDYAKKLGMKDTHFMNATGWPDDLHMTTARDLATLARAIINDYPEHYSIYSEKVLTYNGITQPNRNRLLQRDPSVDGLKTGHTQSAGYCLVASSLKQGMRLISVVLGTASDEVRTVESQKLLAYGFRYYQTQTLYQKGAEITKARVWKGKADDVVLGVANKVVLTVARGTQDQLKAEVVVDQNLQAPITQGQKLGEFVVNLEGKEVYRAPLVALIDVPEAGFFSRLWDSIVLLMRNIFG